MSQEQQEPDKEDTFLETSEIAEVVGDEGADGEPSDEEMDQVEIDLSNNSSSYFDRHSDSVYLVESHPTLPLAVTGGGDNMAYLWTTHANPSKLAAELTGHGESVIAGGFTADGNYVVTGDMAGHLRVWKAKSGGERWEFYTGVHEVDEIVWITFHPSLPVFAVGAQDGTVWVYEVAPKFTNLAVLAAHSSQTNNGIFVNSDDEDQLTLVTVSEDATIICWNVYQSQAVYTLGPIELHGEHPWVSVTSSPSSKSFAAGSLDGFLVIVKVEDGTVLQCIDTADEGTEEDARSIEGISWSDKVNLVAVGNVEGVVKLYDVSNWRVRSTIHTGAAVTKLQFIPGSKNLVTSDMDGTVAVWDALSGAKVWESQGHSGGILGFAGQNNYQRIITAGDEGVSLVFETTSS